MTPVSVDESPNRLSNVVIITLTKPFIAIPCKKMYNILQLELNMSNLIRLMTQQFLHLFLCFSPIIQVVKKCTSNQGLGVLSTWAKSRASTYYIFHSVDFSKVLNEFSLQTQEKVLSAHDL